MAEVTTHDVNVFYVKVPIPNANAVIDYLGVPYLQRLSTSISEFVERQVAGRKEKVDYYDLASVSTSTMNRFPKDSPLRYPGVQKVVAWAYNGELRKQIPLGWAFKALEELGVKFKSFQNGDLHFKVPYENKFRRINTNALAVQMNKGIVSEPHKIVDLLRRVVANSPRAREKLARGGTEEESGFGFLFDTPPTMTALAPEPISTKYRRPKAPKKPAKTPAGVHLKASRPFKRLNTMGEAMRRAGLVGENGELVLVR